MTDLAGIAQTPDRGRPAQYVTVHERDPTAQRHGGHGISYHDGVQSIGRKCLARVRADESSAACYQYRLHIFPRRIRWRTANISDGFFRNREYEVKSSVSA